MYIMDAALEESENCSGSLKEGRIQTPLYRITPPEDGDPGGHGTYDIYNGGQVPMLPLLNTDYSAFGSPRAAWKLHNNKGMVSSFADSHAEMLTPPRDSSIINSTLRIRRYLWRKMGVKDTRLIVDGLESLNGCSLGDKNYDY